MDTNKCQMLRSSSLQLHHNHHRLNVHVSMLSTGGAVPTKQNVGVLEHIFYGRMPFLISTPPIFEPMRV